MEALLRKVSVGLLASRLGHARAGDRDHRGRQPAGGLAADRARGGAGRALRDRRFGRGLGAARPPDGRHDRADDGGRAARPGAGGGDEDGPLQRLVALRQDAADASPFSPDALTDQLDAAIAEARAIISAFHPAAVRELSFEASLRAAIAPFPAARKVDLTVRGTTTTSC
jgi:hypothetical protein